MTSDVVGKADPYATFRVAEVKKRTKTDKRGGQHPEWDEEVRFDITDEPKSKKLEVEIYNEDVREDDFIGSARVDLQKVLSKGEQDEWFEIKSRVNKYAGEILLEMTFYDTNALPKKPNSTPSKNSNLQYSQTNKPASYPITNNQFTSPPIVNNLIASPPTQSSMYPPPVSQSTPLYPPPPTQYPPQTSSYVPGYPSYSSPPLNTNTSSAQVGGSNSLGFPIPLPTPNVSTNLSNVSTMSYYNQGNSYPSTGQH
ncbi:4214_t:CDS:2 [Diversispora eburnea]|uniref:4214_t:CDS:1 n=1 Tax=Diversispora eburnea TaxID=1213867 RepID=A0A9N8V781_9GLOM|nr:4214_t:CDS:2 [Diversispora eburnea]